jgi:hypothetical protein
MVYPYTDLVCNITGFSNFVSLSFSFLSHYFLLHGVVYIYNYHSESALLPRLVCMCVCGTHFSLLIRL